jgi:putative DNA primase/helicase
MADDTAAADNIVRLQQANDEATATQDAVALIFATVHAGNLRYVATWGKWLAWDGTRWAPDDTLHTYDRIRTLCRVTAREAGAKLGSAQQVSAIEKLAKSDRRLAATADQWDAANYLLNTPAGVADLHTGELRPHRAEDYLTKTTAAGPDPACPMPLWTAFLSRVTGGDAALVAFLRRALGYALTGDTREHGLFFCYGTGANGKSVLTSTMAGILGDYHTTAPIETFLASTQERHPTDLAGLRGARLVTAVETEEGRRWAESKLKTLTGGDKMAARFMRQDFFEFLPQFKLWIAGNHKPRLRSVDEAIKRRFHLVPFTVTIPPQERDQHLGEKLKAEWPGILHWLIGGCRAWQQQGLAAPPAVTDATENYLQAEDTLGAWVEECCTRDRDAWEPTSALFESWKSWTEQSGERVGTRRQFAQALETHGFPPCRKNTARGVAGLLLAKR